MPKILNFNYIKNLPDPKIQRNRISELRNIISHDIEPFRLLQSYYNRYSKPYNISEDVVKGWLREDLEFIKKEKL